MSMEVWAVKWFGWIRIEAFTLSIEEWHSWESTVKRNETLEISMTPGQGPSIQGKLAIEQDNSKWTWTTLFTLNMLEKGKTQYQMTDHYIVSVQSLASSIISKTCFFISNTGIITTAAQDYWKNYLRSST
jgi:hypothetical protein